MEIEVKNLPQMRVAGLRHVGPYYKIGAVFERLMPWAQEHGIQPKGMLAVYHDDPSQVPEDQLRSDALLIVDEGFQCDEDGAVAYDMPADTYAVATHVGPYSGLPNAWNEFMGNAISASGHQMKDGFFFELYVDDCSVVPPETCRTELYAPISR